MSKIKIYIAGIIALISALSIPLFFIFSGTIVKFLYELYPMKVDERFTGGAVLTEFNDPFGDDKGEGALTYPASEFWKTPGTLDLIRYVIHKPVTGGTWGAQKVYWQIDLTFAALENPLNAPAGFSHPVIHIYIDIDGTGSGSTVTLEPDTEKVSFSQEYPWDYCACFDGFNTSGKLVSADGKYQVTFPMYLDRENNTVIIRLPLDKGAMLDILDDRTTAHYVLVGACSLPDRGHFMNVIEGSSSAVTAGGAASPLSPRVFDILESKQHPQPQVLSSYIAASGSPAILFPVIAGANIQPEAPLSADRLEQLRLAAEQEKNSTATSGRTQQEILADQTSDTDKMIALFNAGHIEPAAKLAETILSQESENAMVLAYYGSITAIHAGQASSVVEAVRLVEKAYELFDKAQKLMHSDDQLLYLYLNRGNVSMNVPEAVFHRNIQGAEDFEKAAAIYATMSPEHARDAAQAIYNAGQCLELAGQNLRAEIMFRRAAAQPTLSAALQYKLAQKGYYQ